MNVSSLGRRVVAGEPGTTAQLTDTNISFIHVFESFGCGHHGPCWEVANVNFKRVGPVLGLLLVIAAGAVFLYSRPKATSLVLTGIVTTDDVVVGPQVGGRVDRLLVREGDGVTRDQL